MVSVCGNKFLKNLFNYSLRYLSYIYKVYTETKIAEKNALFENIF